MKGRGKAKSDLGEGRCTALLALVGSLRALITPAAVQSQTASPPQEQLMTNRVSASIRIGGSLSAAVFAELVSLIQDEDLAIEWDGEAFAPQHRVIGAPLQLYAHEVAGGRFTRLERWCCDKHLPFARWSGACQGEWSAERIVYSGTGLPKAYSADEEDHILMNRAVAEQLGSFEAILAWFDAADTLPALRVEGDPTDPSIL